MRKMLIMHFSHNFRDKKTDEKAKNLIPEYGKNVCYKISGMEKCLFCYFHTIILLYEIVWKSMLSFFCQPVAFFNRFL